MSTAGKHGVRVCIITVLLTTATWGDEHPKWIWNPVHQVGAVPPGACYFRGSCQLDKVTTTFLDVAADDTFEVYLNGRIVGQGGGWKHFTRYEVTKYLNQGLNVVAIKVINRTNGTAGLAVRLTTPHGKKPLLVSNGHWRTYTGTFPKWQWTRYADRNWKTAMELGDWGKTNPWIETSLPTARQVAAQQSSTRPERATAADDSRVVLASGEEAVPRRRPKPLLLKPLEALGLVKKRPARSGAAPTEVGSRPTPAASSGQERPQPQPAKPPSSRNQSKAIVNPYVGDQKNKAPLRIENPPKAVAIDAPQMTLPEEKIDLANRFTPREGFSVEPILSHARTGSLISATFNEFGQVLAGQENGPLLLLADSNDDGELDSVKTYSDKVTNCHGILALSGMVFVIGEGPDGPGLYRLEDQDRNGALERIVTLATFDVSRAEHGPHGIVLGPEGNLYIVVGNHATLNTKFSKRSPRRHLYEGDLVPRHEDPGGHANGIRLPAGCVLRTDIQGKKFELFASGLRNAYDLAFNQEGQLFTFDSDMESDSGTTWYRPTRVYHVAPGSEFGWRSGWAKWPAYYHDVIPPVAEAGRGSPTGIVFYQHDAYPEDYQNVAFLADWSGGRILVGRPTPQGTGYAMDTEVFLKGQPLNVTDIEVGPDGLLYFVTGGRGTAGGLYRVAWNDPFSHQRDLTGIDAALEAPQIQSSWGRQQVASVRLDLGEQWDDEIQNAALDESRTPEARIQAVQLMQWIGPIPSPEFLIELSRADQATVRRSAAYFLSSLADQEPVALRLLELLSDPHAAVRRQASESLVRANRSVPFEYVEPLLRSTDRLESWAGRRLLSLDNPREWQPKVLATDHARTFIQAATASLVAWPKSQVAKQVVDRGIALMRGYLSDDDFLDLIRVLQLAMVRGNLQPADVPQLAAAVAEEFPANHGLMNRELIRLLVHLQVTNIKARYLEHLESDLSDADKIHVALHLKFLQADWTADERQRLLTRLTPSSNSGSSASGHLENVARELAKSFGPLKSVPSSIASASPVAEPPAATPESTPAPIAASVESEAASPKKAAMKNKTTPTASTEGEATPNAIAAEGPASVPEPEAQQADDADSILAAIMELPRTLSLEQIASLKKLDQSLTKVDPETKRAKVAILAVMARDGKEEAMAYLREVFDNDPTRRLEIVIGLAEKPNGKNWDYLVRSLPTLEGELAREVLTVLLGVSQSPRKPETYDQVIGLGMKLGDNGGEDVVRLLEHWQGYAQTEDTPPWNKALKAWRNWLTATYPDFKPSPLPEVASASPTWNYEELVAYIDGGRLADASLQRGRNLFHAAQCANCHRHGELGESMGPNLTGLGKRFRNQEILEAIVHPSRVISDQYQAKTLVTDSGLSYTGIVGFAGQGELLVLESTGQKTRVPTDSVIESVDSPISAMPAALLESYSPEQIADLVAFLKSEGEQLAETPQPTKR